MVDFNTCVHSTVLMGIVNMTHKNAVLINPMHDIMCYVQETHIAVIFKTGVGVQGQIKTKISDTDFQSGHLMFETFVSDNNRSLQDKC